MQWVAIVFALLAGAANPFQTGANAQLKTQLNQPLWATAWVYASGLLGVLLMQLLARQTAPSWQQLGTVSWWAWTGGLISILATFAGLAFAQRLGAGTFTGITITVSTAVSIALDHYGLLGFKPHPASLPRILGGMLMAAGIWLVAKF